MSEWQCGSCGAIIDAAIAEDDEPYHDPDEDCRAVRRIEAEEERRFHVAMRSGTLADYDRWQEAVK